MSKILEAEIEQYSELYDKINEGPFIGPHFGVRLYGALPFPSEALKG